LNEASEASLANSGCQALRVEDVYIQGRRTWLRLHEKGGKRHEMPAHHVLDQYLDEYRKASGAALDPKGHLFRTIRGRTGVLTDEPMAQADAYRARREDSCENLPQRFYAHRKYWNLLIRLHST